MHVINQFLIGFSHIGLKEIGVIFAILVMDAALSADNSIAINALAMNVSQNLRSKVIWAGMIVAAILRVVALVLASWMISNPWVQVLAGGYLCYLVYTHFFGTKNEDGESNTGKTGFWWVLLSIGVLDLSLSTDNVIAVVAMSNNIAVITIGVLASIAMLAIASQIVRVIMEKIPTLESGAYCILLFLAIIMFVGHTADTIVWLGNKCNIVSITNNIDTIMRYRFEVSDTLEILGVALIITGAVIYDKLILKPVKTSLS